MADTRTIRVIKEHEIAGARQAASGLTQSAGFSKLGTAHVATAVTEMASNLFFHASDGGSIILTLIEEEGSIGIQVVCDDHGPGIEDLKLAMQDGYSTKGSMGSGLPGVKRLMDVFEITSEVGVGTRIVAKKWKL